MDRRKHAADESAALEGRDALVGLSFKAIDKVGGACQGNLTGIFVRHHDLVVATLGNFQVFALDGADVVNGSRAIKAPSNISDGGGSFDRSAAIDNISSIQGKDL